MRKVCGSNLAYNLKEVEIECWEAVPVTVFIILLQLSTEQENVYLYYALILFVSIYSHRDIHQVRHDLLMDDSSPDRLYGNQS